MGPPKSFFSDTLLSAINSVAAILKPFALVYLINNNLGTDAYGEIAVFLSSVALVSVLSSLGTGFSMKRHISTSENIKVKRRLFYSPINFQLVLLTFYFVLGYAAINSVMDRISAQQFITFCFYYFASIIFQYFLEYRRWIVDSRGFVVLSVTYNTLFLVTLLILFKFDLVEDVNQILIIDAFIMLIIFAYLLLSVHREFGFFFGTFSFKELIAEMKLGFPFAVGGLGEITMATADRFMIVYFFGLLEAGLYSTGYMIGSLSLIFARVIGLFLPQHMFANRDSTSVQGVNDLLNVSLFSFLCVSIPFIFLLILTGSEVLSYLNIVSEEAHFSMIFISASSVFLGTYLLACSVTFMEKKTDQQMKLVIIFSLINIALNYGLMSTFDSFVMASAVTLITYAALLLSFIWYLGGIWVFSFRAKFIQVPLGASLLSYVITDLCGEMLVNSQVILIEGLFFIAFYFISLFGLIVK